MGMDLGVGSGLGLNRNSHATSFAVTCIIVGTKCTCDMSQLKTRVVVP